VQIVVRLPTPQQSWLHSRWLAIYHQRMKSIYLALLVLLTLTACSQPDQPTIGLYPAIHQGDINQIQRHIKWGTDIDQVDGDGRRPLHVAAAQGRYAIVKLLLKSGANIDALDRQDRSALFTALLASRARVADLLIKQGARYDANRLLMEVIGAGVDNRDVIQLLARLGADMNHTDAQGSTPLLQAIQGGHRVLAKHLIAQGADVNKPDARGLSPLRLAVRTENDEIARLLQRNGAQPVIDEP